MKADINVGAGKQQGTAVSFWTKRRHVNYSREIVLIICFVLLVLLFSVTAVVSRLYHKKIHMLADQWYAIGEASFRAGRVRPALSDYRNALVYAPNSALFQLHLAQALAAANRLDEANSYFVNLLAESPGNGEINLELARIYARKRQALDAIRYYHSAIYGVWDTDPLVKRWSVRRELCEYLLARGDVKDAQPEVIALAQEVPAGDLERQKEAAALLQRAGLHDRALAEFQSILKFDAGDQDALMGAATSSYQLARYARALDYFERLSRENAVDQAAADMMDKSEQIEAANPLRKGLLSEERATRASDALAHAVTRIEDCAREHPESLSQTPAPDKLHDLYASSREMERDWSEPNLQRHTDRVEAVMSLVFQMENAAAQACGEPSSGPDHALLLLGRSRQGENE
jgi:tetratricopeptide (TPR) repeat protein